MVDENIINGNPRPRKQSGKTKNFANHFNNQLEDSDTIQNIANKISQSQDSVVLIATEINRHNISLENKTLKEKIASYLIVLSILGGVLVGLLALAASFYVSYSALQREFLQTKIEQQNERIKKLEQNQNPILQFIN